MIAERDLGSLTEQLHTFLVNVQRETNVPGIGVALSVAGRRVSAQVGTLEAGGRSPLTAAARFQLGCILKLLLALAALELAARGVLDADAPIGEYLAELRTAPLGRAVRLRHLLSHTSGYRGTDIMDPEARTLTWEGFVAYLCAGTRFFAPGGVFNYEHSEAVLLAAILERVTGRAVLDVVQAIVLEPLSIPPPTVAERCDAAVRVLDHRYDGQLGRFVPEDAPAPVAFWRAAFSSATLRLTDLLAVAETLFPGDRPAPTAAALLQPSVRLPPMIGGPLRELLPIAFGQGAASLRGGWFGNTGVARGQCVGLRFAPQERVAVAVGLNAFAPHLRDLILTVACASATGRSAAGDASVRADFDLAALEGLYAGNGRRIIVARHSHRRLTCAIGRAGSPHALHAELAVDDGGRLMLVSPAPQLSIGIGREPGTETPLLMIGLNAFKRLGGVDAAALTG